VNIHRPGRRHPDAIDAIIKERQEWEKILGEMEAHRVYDRIPEGRPYGSMDAPLRAELGVTADESCKVVAARAEHPGTINPNGVKDHDISCNNVTGDIMQRGNNADYLTARIARDRPDILARMKAGEFRSVRAAAREAGIVRPTATMDIDDPDAAGLKM
jgi:hypothetical protein